MSRSRLEVLTDLTLERSDDRIRPDRFGNSIFGHTEGCPKNFSGMVGEKKPRSDQTVGAGGTPKGWPIQFSSESRKMTIFRLFSEPMELVETPSMFWISEWMIRLS